jgi:hypothetical protein
MIQAVFHWLVTKQARDRAQGNSCGINVRKLTLGYGFLGIRQLILTRSFYEYFIHLLPKLIECLLLALSLSNLHIIIYLPLISNALIAQTRVAQPAAGRAATCVPPLYYTYVSRSLSYESVISSTANSPQDVTYRFLFQFSVPSSFLKVIQQLLTSSSSSSCPFYCSMNNDSNKAISTPDVTNPVIKPCIYSKSDKIIYRRGISRGKLSYLAPLGSEKISAPYFEQCFFRGGRGYYPPPPRLSQTPHLPVPRQK